MEEWLLSDMMPCYPPSLTQPSSRVDFIYKSILSLISALAYVHSETDGHWIGQFDIKPATVLLFEENGNWIWKLADFEHSRFQSKNDIESATGERPLALGTSEYQPRNIWGILRTTKSMCPSMFLPWEAFSFNSPP